MARGKPHDPQLKAAVMAALLTGQSIDKVAEEFALPTATVRAWRNKLKAENIVSEPQKRDEFGELILGYLRENITTLTAQSIFARDTDWLRAQPASEVAVLHGVLADKTFRLLAALEPDPEPITANPADSGASD